MTLQCVSEGIPKWTLGSFSARERGARWGMAEGRNAHEFQSAMFSILLIPVIHYPRQSDASWFARREREREHVCVAEASSTVNIPLELSNLNSPRISFFQTDLRRIENVIPNSTNLSKYYCNEWIKEIRQNELSDRSDTFRWWKIRHRWRLARAINIICRNARIIVKLFRGKFQVWYSERRAIRDLSLSLFLLAGGRRSLDYRN